MMDVSIATAQKSETPTSINVGGGQKFDVSDVPTKTLHTTAGKTIYTFRVDIPGVSIISTSAAGAILYITALDGAFGDEALIKLKEKFIYYRLVDLVVTFRSISPFATASGSAQIFVNPDPSNPVSQTPATALLQAMRLLGSGQLSSKSELTMVLSSADWNSRVWDSQWRYCKTAGTPRAESFGFLCGICRAPPAKGDGAQWAMTLSGSVELCDATINSVTTVGRIRVESVSAIPTIDVNVHEAADTVFIVSIGYNTNIDPPDSAGNMVLDYPVRGSITFTDIDDTTYEETYPLDFAECDYVTATGTTRRVVLRTEIHARRGTDITTPRVARYEFPGVDNTDAETWAGVFNGYLLFETAATPGYRVNNAIETRAAQGYEEFRAAVHRIFSSRPSEIRKMLAAKLAKTRSLRRVGS